MLNFLQWQSVRNLSYLLQWLMISSFGIILLLGIDLNSIPHPDSFFDVKIHYLPG